MERLLVKNFGPIKEAELILKDINIFIGTTSSGKSTVAKLFSIFKSPAVHVHQIEDFSLRFRQQLADNNINFSFYPETLIRYEHGQLIIEIKGGSLSITPKVLTLPPVSCRPIYIPAERTFFPTFSQSIFGLINGNIALPKWLVEFGAKFEQARTQLKKYPLNFLGASYEFDGNTDYISVNDQTKIKLSQASSGLQSVVPLLLVVQFNTGIEKRIKDFFVIEEPELNLYPSSQVELVGFLIERINSAKDKLIITTHSPYLLTAIDNLIQAYNVASANKDVKNKVAELVPESRWIDFDRVSCFYFDKGTCRSTLDTELKSIGPSNIDDVSTDLSRIYEALLALKYPS